MVVSSLKRAKYINFTVLTKFVFAHLQVLVSMITKTKTPSDQYQSPMCPECDSSVNTVAKISNEFASVDLLTNEK